MKDKIKKKKHWEDNVPVFQIDQKNLPLSSDNNFQLSKKQIPMKKRVKTFIDYNKKFTMPEKPSITTNPFNNLPIDNYNQPNSEKSDDEQEAKQLKPAPKEIFLEPKKRFDRITSRKDRTTPNILRTQSTSPAPWNINNRIGRGGLGGKPRTAKSIEKEAKIVNTLNQDNNKGLYKLECLMKYEDSLAKQENLINDIKPITKLEEIGGIDISCIKQLDNPEKEVINLYRNEVVAKSKKKKRRKKKKKNIRESPQQESQDSKKQDNPVDINTGNNQDDLEEINQVIARGTNGVKPVKIPQIVWHNKCKLKTISDHQILCEVLEAIIENPNFEENENFLQKCGIKFNVDEEGYPDPLDLLLDVDKGEIKNIGLMRLGNKAFLNNINEAKLLLIVVERAFGVLKEKLRLTELEYSQKLKEIVNWLQLNYPTQSTTNILGNFDDGDIEGNGQEVIADIQNLSATAIDNKEILNLVDELKDQDYYKKDKGKKLPKKGFWQGIKCYICGGEELPINDVNKTTKTNSSNHINLLADNEFDQILKNEMVGLDETSYKGEQRNGVRRGKGKLVAKNGKVIYEGHWKNNKKEGKGVSYYETGYVQYTGEFRSDHYDGKGVYYDQDSFKIYEGCWKIGQKSGKGKCYYNNGNIKYQGLFAKDDYNGYGIYFHPLYNGVSIYEGEFVDGKKEGKGIGLYFSKVKGKEDAIEKKYDGNWRSGKWHGDGVLYERNWEKGSMEGKQGRWKEGSIVL